VRRLLPNRSDPNGLIDDGDSEARIAASIAEGYE
jgi:hypothetical protein